MNSRDLNIQEEERKAKIVGISNAKAFFDHIRVLLMGIPFIEILKNGIKTLASSPIMNIFFAPVMILSAIVSTVNAVRLAVITKHSYFITKAVFETLAAGAVIAASIGILAGIAAFAFVAPVLIFAALAVKTVLDIIDAVELGRLAYSVQDKQCSQYQSFRISAISKTHNAILTGLVAAATLTLALVAGPVVQIAVAAAAVGVLGTSLIIGIVSAFVQNRRMRQAKQHDDSLKPKDESPGARNTHEMNAQLGQGTQYSCSSHSSDDTSTSDCDLNSSVVVRPQQYVSNTPSVPGNSSEQQFSSQRRFSY